MEPCIVVALLLAGTVCDDEDNIYCIDRDSNKILTCSHSGDHIQFHSMPLEKDNCGLSTLINHYPSEVVYD